MNLTLELSLTGGYGAGTASSIPLSYLFDTGDAYTFDTGDIRLFN